MDRYVDFEAESTIGKIKLSDFLSQYDFVVLYFYPKAFTFGCTIELKKFVELYEEFRKYKAEVIGVSNDDIDTLKKFADKYGARFPLVSDVDLKIINSYGVKSKRGRGASRVTFVIDKEGKIIEIIKSYRADEHPIRALEKIKSFSND